MRHPFLRPVSRLLLVALAPLALDGIGENAIFALGSKSDKVSTSPPRAHRAGVTAACTEVFG